MTVSKSVLWSEDIFESGLANNWPSLNRRITEEDFPPGHMVGRRRCWTAREVLDWIESRPSENKSPLKGFARRKSEGGVHAA
jgi:hypothetical protein